MQVPADLGVTGRRAGAVVQGCEQDCPGDQSGVADLDGPDPEPTVRAGPTTEPRDPRERVLAAGDDLGVAPEPAHDLPAPVGVLEPLDVVVGPGAYHQPLGLVRHLVRVRHAAAG